jgi:hypothetical protein
MATAFPFWSVTLLFSSASIVFPPTQTYDPLVTGSRNTLPHRVEHKSNAPFRRAKYGGTYGNSTENLSYSYSTSSNS